MTKPLISIVIPAFDAAMYLVATLESVRAQTEPGWELVIVDDGSSDRTWEIASDYVRLDPRIRVVHQANMGQAAARNRGLSETSGESCYVIFLDHDDIWEPGALCALRRALEADPGAVAAHGVGRFIDADGVLIRPDELESKVRQRRGVVGTHVTDWPREAPTTFAVLIVDCCLVSPGLVLIRRCALAQIGLLDVMPSLGFSSLDDWDLWLRLSRSGPLAVADEVVLNYRLHAGNLSRHRRAMCLGDWHVRRKTIGAAELSPEQRRIARCQYEDFLSLMRRDMATQVRRVAFQEFSQFRQRLFQSRPASAWALLRLALSHYWIYFDIRLFATAQRVWTYTQMEDQFLPERLRRTS